MLNYIRSEFYRVFHSKGIYVTLALLAACAILINAVLACFGAVSPDFAYDNTSFAMQFLLQLPLLYPFAALLIVYVLYEGAGKNGNLKNAVAFGVSREKLLAGQFVVSTIVSLAAMVVTLGVYFACAYALLDFDATIAGTEVIRQVLCVLPTAIASLILALLCVNMTDRGFVGILVWLLVMILIPEIPFNLDAVCDFVGARIAAGETYTMIAVAEGAVLDSEARFKKEERVFVRPEQGEATVTRHLAEVIGARTGQETRYSVLGYLQRGGTPCAYDRLLCTRLGAYAAKLAAEGRFGVTAAVIGNKITFNALPDIAGKYKFVDPQGEEVALARSIGISFGDRA